MCVYVKEICIQFYYSYMNLETEWFGKCMLKQLSVRHAWEKLYFFGENIFYFTKCMKWKGRRNAVDISFIILKYLSVVYAF